MPEIGNAEVVEKVVEPVVNAIPKRAIDAEADKMIRARKLPSTLKGSVDFQSMISWLKMLTPEMWKHVIVYVYRWEPVIKNQQANAEASNYVDVIGEIFGEDYIISRHGGGKYGFFVNDTDLTKNGTLFKSSLNVPTTTYPPILDIATLDTTAKDNAKWVQYYRSKGLLDENYNPTSAKKPEPPANNEANMMLNMMDKMMGMYERMDRKQQERIRENIAEKNQEGLGSQIGTILIEQMKQQDPNKSIDSFAKLAGMFKSGDNSQIFTTMLTMFQGMQTQQMEMMREQTKIMFESLKEVKNSGKAGGEEEEGEDGGLTKLDHILNIAERLGAKFGGRSGPTSTFDKVMEYVAPVVPGVLNIVNNILAMKASNPNPIAGVNPTPNNVIPIQRPMIQSNNPFLNPDLNRIAKEESERQGGPQMVQQPVSPQATQPEPPQAPTNEVVGTIKQLGGLVRKNIEDGKAGWEFAESVVSIYGVPVHAMVAKHGTENIIAGMKLVPDFWNPLVQTFGEPYLTKWVEEFIFYEETIARMEQEEDGEEILEPEVITEKKGKKK